jgi:hypothetical protein
VNWPVVKGGNPLEVQAECPWCGMVTLRPNEVRCEADPRTEEANCPVCHRVVYAKTTTEGVTVIRAAGAQGIEGLVPFELLERRSGPPLLWDELLDILADLDLTEFPHAGLVDQFYSGMPMIDEPSEDASSRTQ